MRAIAIVPGTEGAKFVARPEPQIEGASDVKLRVLRVGICGTDREEIAGGRADAPAGASELVIGHEMLGQVAAVGGAVRRVQVGDLAVFTVRRGCGQCANCSMHRSDMCQTGHYTERGIKGRDGYQAEFAVDAEEHVTRVPRELAAVGVLLEPLSIVEKAIAEALALQQRRDPHAASTPSWFSGARCLVAGLGPVGLLAALVLRLRGGEVWGLDLLDENTPRPEWLAGIGGVYVDVRKFKPGAGALKDMAIVVDASGFAALEFELLNALALNGVYALTGIPPGNKLVEVPAAALLRQMVLANQIMVGSVNAARGHFQMASDDLAAARLRFGRHIEGLITHYHTPEEFVAGVHPAGAIKEVVAWGEAQADGNSNAQAAR